MGGWQEGSRSSGEPRKGGGRALTTMAGRGRALMAAGSSGPREGHMGCGRALVVAGIARVAGELSWWLVVGLVRGCQEGFQIFSIINRE